jgi:hypothetical protein
VEWHWVDSVLYFEYTPLTVEYDPELDAFTIARADVYTPGLRHRLTLTVVVTDHEISLERLALDVAIERGRALLERLIAEQRGHAQRQTADTSLVFDLAARRVR